MRAAIVAATMGGMRPEVPPTPMSPDEERLWRGLIRLMIALPRVIDEDLTRTGGISLSRYIVLMRLSEAPGQSLRMSDLATASSLSPSRLTRIVQPMVSKGLVTRQSVPGDARAAAVHLTEQGLRRLQDAWPAHLAGVRALVLDHVESQELAGFERVVQRLADAVEQADASAPPIDGIPPGPS